MLYFNNMKEIFIVYCLATYFTVFVPGESVL